MKFETRINGKPASLSEDSWVLLLAASDSAAKSRAARIGQGREHSYLNESRESVAWVFTNIVDIQRIDGAKPSDGIEVFSELRDLELEVNAAQSILRGHRHPQNLDLSGHFKTGDWRSLQNRPTRLRQDSFTPLLTIRPDESNHVGLRPGGPLEVEAEHGAIAVYGSVGSSVQIRCPTAKD
ncbi:MAG: DUF4288 domain-containing protein [Archangium sp.]|nr:DUF4288 domain-containing protein [Archangium sp.]